MGLFSNNGNSNSLRPAYWNDDREGNISKIRFQSETTLRYQKEIQTRFSMEAIVSNLARRLYMFNCFVGQEMDFDSFMKELMSDLPEIADQEICDRQVKRFSTRQRSSMKLKGIQGNVYLKENPSRLLLPYLLAGEITHIGRNIRFGFGRYRLM